MNRIIRTLFASVLVLAFCNSCSKEEIADKLSGREMFLTATIAHNDGNTCTKTHLDTFDNDSKLYPVLWSENDEIAVINNSKLFKFRLNDGQGTTRGIFKLASGNADDFDTGLDIEAYYPYSIVTYTGNDVTLAVPATQIYSSNTIDGNITSTFGPGSFPMYARIDKGAAPSLSFKNLYGALKLQLKGKTGEFVKSIKVKSNIAPNLFELNCGTDGVCISELTEFIITLPAGNHSIEVLINTTSATYYKKAGNTLTITAGTILKMPELETSTMGPAYIEENNFYGNGITINNITWAPVNCGYNPQDYPYGKLYQWGRKDGSGYNDGSSFKEELIQATSETAYIWDGTGTCSPNRLRFYPGLSQNYNDWISGPTRYDNLWNGNTGNDKESAPVKTQYDPCPDGWRSPTYSELMNLMGSTRNAATMLNGQAGYLFINPNATSDSDKQLFLPAAGYCNASGESVQRSGYIGLYWSITPYNHQAYCLNFTSNQITPNSLERAFASSVRCVKE